MKNLYWIGIRQSDIIDCKDVFEGSICVAGIPSDNHFVFEKQSKIRVDYSSSVPGYKKFVTECINKILQINASARFMFYTASTAYSSEMQFFNDRFLYVNKKEIYDQLNNKLHTRELLFNEIPVVPFATISQTNISYKNISAYFPNNSRFIIQDIISSGGKGTQLVDETTNLDCYKYIKQSNYIVSPYIEKSIPLNIHCCIYEDDVIVLTPSLQIVCNVESRLLYKGGDFFAFKKLDNNIQSKIVLYAKIAAQKLRSVGFRGICGFDFLATENEVYFLECNPRFQSSTMLLNKALSLKGLPTIQELHISAFTKTECTYSKQEFQELDVNYSMYSFYYDYRINSTNPWLQNIIKCCKNSSAILIYTDGLEEDYITQEGSAMFKLIFSEQIVYYDDEYNQRIQPHLLPTINYEGIDLIKIKIILLNRGVSISNSAQKYFHEYPFDKGFDNITITLKNYDIVVSCPVMMNLNALSPFEIDYVDNNLILLFNGKFLTELDVLFQNPMDKIFLPNSTKNFSKISYLGPDRLRITYFSGCKLKTGNGGCKFCRVQPFSSAHTNHEIAETIKAYSNNKSVRHFLIGGGSDYSNIGYEEIHRVLSELKKENKPIYLMTTPPQDINELKKIKSLGVTEVGFNIEIFDRKKAKELMPIKGAIDLDRYYKAFAEAVKLFGKGSVYCAFIVGIESENTLLQGIEKVCSLGVYPILSLYRETVGSNLNIITPSDDNLECLYNKILQICNKYGVELGPKCKICKNNVIAI